MDDRGWMGRKCRCRVALGWAKDIMATAARVIDTPATWRCDSHFSARDHAALCMISAD